MVGMGGATTLSMATMTTAWLAATRLLAARLAWSGAEVASEEVTAATGAVPLTPSTQHSRWPSEATKIKVRFDFTARNLVNTSLIRQIIYADILYIYILSSSEYCTYISVCMKVSSNYCQMQVAGILPKRPMAVLATTEGSLHSSMTEEMLTEGGKEIKHRCWLNYCCQRTPLL